MVCLIGAPGSRAVYQRERVILPKKKLIFDEISVGGIDLRKECGPATQPFVRNGAEIAAIGTLLANLFVVGGEIEAVTIHQVAIENDEGKNHDERGALEFGWDGN